MATLVLSTVGSALGGPVGGAIGSLIGQSIDQQMFSSATRGPRLSDLAVQTSSYGTQVPRIYGVMRVAGSVVWSTDLVESNVTAGAKGQPDVTYSYSVSFAVALSSRPLREVRRIWADGKLLRGAAGDLKVATDFRFYPGGEDQVIDPLIASVEGIDSTPAYRGMALAVFENLELADYGNRIPFLTFEVVGDDAEPSLGSILADAGGGCIAVADGRTVVGYAALGRSIEDSVAPLVETFAIQAVDVGGALGSPSSGTIVISNDELGSSADSGAERMQRQQDAARTLPSSVLVSYYDPERDYQLGLARADGGSAGGDDRKADLPAVLSAATARGLAEEIMARAWAERERLKIALPPARLALKPGSTVELPFAPGSWRVESSSIEGMAVVLELRREWQDAPPVRGDAGRANSAPDLLYGPASLWVGELPGVDGAAVAGPTISVAASSASAGWRPLALEVLAAGAVTSASSAAAKAALGEAITALGEGSSALIDEAGTVDVQLVDPAQWLNACDDDALIGGVNLAVLGKEVLQFGGVEPLGGGRFRLTRLLRGRGGTEWAMSTHVAGEAFLLIQPASVRQIALPTSAIGSSVVVRQAGQDSISASLAVSGDALRPWAPVGLRADQAASGDLEIGWTRRTRVPCGWIDEVDVPLGESTERYSVSVSAGAQSVERVVSDSGGVIAAADLGALVGATATVSVRQLGDWGASRPATIQIALN